MNIIGYKLYPWFELFFLGKSLELLDHIVYQFILQNSFPERLKQFTIFLAIEKKVAISPQCHSTEYYYF